MAKKFNTNTDNEEQWLTPPSIIKSLGEFDLDPCSPIDRPWPTAKNHYTKLDDGLLMPWYGRVWNNPPYGRQLTHWLHKMALHGDGIALTFARTETAVFQDYVFPFAESMFFIRGRIKFYTVDGKEAPDNGGAPSVLLSYGEENADAIESSGIKGRHVPLKQRFFITGISLDQNKSWRIVVGEALEELGREAQLKDIYDAVMRLAPSRVSKNKHYQAKIRQTLQLHYEKVKTATYKLN